MDAELYQLWKANERKERQIQQLIKAVATLTEIVRYYMDNDDKKDKMLDEINSELFKAEYGMEDSPEDLDFSDGFQ